MAKTVKRTAKRSMHGGQRHRREPTDASAGDASVGDPSAETLAPDAARGETPSAEALAWYAVHTRAQKEAYADLHLRRQGFTTFFPFVSEWVGLGTKRARLKKRAWLAR